MVFLKSKIIVCIRNQLMLFTKKNRYLTYITLFFCFSNHITAAYITKKNTLLSALAAITAYCAIKTMSQLYTSYYYPEEAFTQNCNNNYTKISREAQNCLKIYYTVCQLSDLDLKEIIYTQNRELYPFLRYQEAIAQELRKFTTYSASIQNELKTIPSIKATARYPQKLEDLENHGKSIEKQIHFITTLLTILNQRILLFTEYQEDCAHLMH